MNLARWGRNDKNKNLNEVLPFRLKTEHVTSGLFPALLLLSHMSLYFNFPAIKWLGQYFLSPTGLPGYDLSGGGRVDNCVNVR